MRKRLWVALLGVGVAAVVALVAALALRPAEPRYGGRALSEWVRGYRPGSAEGSEWVRGYAPGDRIYQQCNAAVQQIGTNAVPFLLEWMQYERPAWKRTAYELIHRLIPRVKPSWKLKDTKRERADGTVQAFFALGDKATNAIGDLAKLMNDPAREDVTFRAAIVLASLGKPGWVPLFGAVTNQQVDFRTRLYLIQSLRLPDNEERLVAVFQKLQLDPDPWIRSMASNQFRHLTKVRPELRETKLKPEIDAKVGESK